jgi:hypothetical protein
MIYTLTKKQDSYYLHYGHQLIACTHEVGKVAKLDYSKVEQLISNNDAVKKANLYSKDKKEFNAHSNYLQGYLDCQEDNIHKEFSLWDMLKLAESVWNSEVIDLISFKNYIANNYKKQSEWVVDIVTKNNNKETPEIKNGFITIKKIK